ncbi:hypothetical protein HEB94_004861 [Actinopolymorpha pittospori]|uniref:Uncharacterized protein n=1 Tax=Actinopolymorpha pittospori TaxID=648752 RepID=A0A927RLM9_9ACTN|nr:hypothetical protein [Actinopolymorpha pittospori]
MPAQSVAVRPRHLTLVRARQLLGQGDNPALGNLRTGGKSGLRFDTGTATQDGGDPEG